MQDTKYAYILSNCRTHKKLLIINFISDGYEKNQNYY